MQVDRFIVVRQEAGSLLIDCLASHLSFSKKKAKKLLNERVVFVNGKRVWMARHSLRQSDTVEVHTTTTHHSTESRIKILHKDADYIIADKPPGLLSNGTDSVESILQRQLQLPDLTAVHRLDRDTSGCLLFSRNRRAHGAAIELFRGREVHKTYHAIVAGRMREDTQSIRRSLDEQQAITKFRVLDAGDVASHLQLVLVTGRTHQIRRHLASIHHPVVGDKNHAPQRRYSDILRTVPRQMLHARRISFRPQDGEVIRCESPLPGDFRACLRILRLH